MRRQGITGVRLYPKHACKTKEEQIVQRFLWVDHLPGASLQGGIELANRLYWNVTWREHAARRFVYSGEDLIYTSASREAAEAFLYGLGLAYAVLPEDTFDHLEYLVKELVAPEDITPEESARYGDRLGAIRE